MSQNIDQILNDLKSALKTAPATGNGIADSASRQQVVINDNGVSITKMRVDRVQGDLTVENRITATDIRSADAHFTNIYTTNEIHAAIIRAQKIITDKDLDSYSKAITFTSEGLTGLDGKGMLFSQPEFTHQFIFKTTPQKFFSTEHIDLYRGKTLQIDGVPVIEAGKLGDSIVSSNLTRVGQLEKLRTVGDSRFGDTLFVNDSYGRVSINTDITYGALTVYDNNVDFFVGADEAGSTARIGTHSVARLSLVTDDTDRIVLSGNNITIGNPKSRNSEVMLYGNMTVEGTLRVAKLITDIKYEQTSNIEFNTTPEDSAYGKGVMWKGLGPTKSIFLAPNPDRIISTESIDLTENHGYYINKELVIDHEKIGEKIKSSHLTKVGILTELSVEGVLSVAGYLEAANNRVNIHKTLAIVGDGVETTITGNDITSSQTHLNISTKDGGLIGVNNLGNITIGDVNRTDRTISAYGQLAVNISNPEPGVAFSVDGIVKMGTQKFISTNSMPVKGAWTKGDIAWNTQPEASGFAGWICILGGTPGTWKPFGYIGE
jgi:hypothetical protein